MFQTRWILILLPFFYPLSPAQGAEDCSLAIIDNDGPVRGEKTCIPIRSVLNETLGFSQHYQFHAILGIIYSGAGYASLHVSPKDKSRPSPALMLRRTDGTTTISKVRGKKPDASSFQKAKIGEVCRFDLDPDGFLIIQNFLRGALNLQGTLFTIMLEQDIRSP